MSGKLEFGEEDRFATLRRGWELSLHLLATKVSKVTFETYIRPAQPQSYVGNLVTLGVSSPFAREWLEKKAANAIRSALEFHLDVSDLQVRFVVQSSDPQPLPTSSKSLASKVNPAQTALSLDMDSEDATERYDTATAGSAAPDSTPVRPKSQNAKTRKTETRRSGQETLPIPSLPLNDRYVFENFLTGHSNRLAHASAMAVAARPGEVYNPLFLYGGPGLGKTHLLQGIAHTLKRTRPEMGVAYISGEFFAQTYIGALRDHATEDFRRQHRGIDVWLVDDMQFIAGKEHTKEEFFHTFNALYQGGKQIVLASDRSPRELNTMDERLRSRFQSGLIADIVPPNLETRIAFLQKCRERENVPIADEVLDYIADAIQSNMRTLEGALTKLIAYSSIMNAPMNSELAQEVLSEYFIIKPIRYRRVTVEEVVDAVAEQFVTTSAAILGPGRNKDIVTARHVAMYISREMIPEMNTMLMGAAFGGRDHATIVYACQRVRTMMDLDSDLRNLVSRMMKSLSN